MIFESLPGWAETVTVVGLETAPMLSTRRTAAPPGAMAGMAGDLLAIIWTGLRPVADFKYMLRMGCLPSLPAIVVLVTGLLITWNCEKVLFPRLTTPPVWRSAPPDAAFITGVPVVVLIVCRLSVLTLAASSSTWLLVVGVPAAVTVALGLLTMRMGSAVPTLGSRVPAVDVVVVAIGFMVLRFR